MWSYAYQQPDQIRPRYVGHWYAMRRPGQHRGIPELTSTLQVGASSRRWREATVSAAETAASFASLLYTDMPPGDADQVRPFESMEIERRMMAALPMGWRAEQMVAQHPNATYDSFNRAQIAECARPKNMPYNMAACDSSQSSYASGRLDFQPYFAGVDIERADCQDTVLNKLFRQWWKEAALVYGFGDPRVLPVVRWDWPNHPVADLAAEANATDTGLRNGTKTLRQVYADNGDDFDIAVRQMAADYGLAEERMRETLRLAVFNGTNQLGSIAQANVQRENAQARQQQGGNQ
jgi:capsid protein